MNIQDARKSLPLNYVHDEHFGAWCDFLGRQKVRALPAALSFLESL